MTTATQTRNQPVIIPSNKAGEFEVDLPASAERKVARLAAAAKAKRDADAEYKDAKAQVFALLPEGREPLKAKEKLIIRIRGKMRAIISGRERTNINAGDLMQGWPEAFEACRSVSEYEQVDTV